MRKAFKSVALALCLLLGMAPVHAGPALLFEADTGRVYYAENQDDSWYPASLTKIMTAYVTFAALEAGRVALDTKLVCSEAAHAEPPSKVGLPVGATMSLELALKTLIVKSANDVAVMLAEGVGGSVEAFVAEMNATAKRLGMTRTRFVNPNGLPAADQVTTARDLALLSRAILRDFPKYADYWTLADVRIGKRRLASHNSLLRTYEGADGLKTGFICDAGYNVVASASRDGRRLMAIVLGEPSGTDRAVRAASLLDHGFQVQGWKQIFNNATIENLPYSADLKGPVSVREQVVSWDCGGRSKAKSVAKNREQARKARMAKKAASDDTDDAEAAEVGEEKPKAAPARKVVDKGSAETATKAKPKSAAAASSTKTP